MSHAIFLTFAALTLVAPSMEAVPAGAASSRAVDSAQSERMLELLRAVAAGHGSPALIDATLAEPGTDLVIAQINLNRTVTKEQYAEVLRAFATGREPSLRSARDPRAQRGVEGLRDVLRALRWGAAHVDLLAERLVALERIHPEAEARRRAEAALPEPLSTDARFHLVMGGRAGGAAIGENVYLDLLAYSAYEATGGLPELAPAEVIEMFAHELHHIELSARLARASDGLQLDPVATRAYALVKLLILEGSATWLVDARRDPARLRRDAGIARQLDRGDSLLVEIEHVLRRTISGEFGRDAYEAARTPLLPSGFHAAGALLFAAIDRAGGTEAVMAVLRDPRRLFVAYNAAVASGVVPGRPFDEALVKSVAALGERGAPRAP